MIRSFKLVDPTKPIVTPWIKNVPVLQERVEFKPGLNVLWGRNGSGKSTLLEALAKIFHCFQSGEQVVTQTSTYFDVERNGDLSSMTIDHDGSPVLFFDPSRKVGLVHGTFDDDFFTEGVASTMFRGSTGETTLRNLGPLLNFVLVKQPAIHKKHPLSNKDWETFLKGTGEKETPTILCDEPDRGFDAPSQLRLWRLLRAAGRKFQVIVATHSLFALDLPDANYIEMSPGYLDEGRKTLVTLAGFHQEPPGVLKPPPPVDEPLPKAKKGE